MLKIKDAIDLKELENYGFEYSEEERNYWKYVFLDRYGAGKQYWIDIDTRIIEFSVDTARILNYDTTIYDLIKADLVEKVESEE